MVQKNNESITKDIRDLREPLQWRARTLSLSFLLSLSLPLHLSFVRLAAPFRSIRALLDRLAMG